MGLSRLKLAKGVLQPKTRLPSVVVLTLAPDGRPVPVVAKRPVTSGRDAVRDDVRDVAGDVDVRAPHVELALLDRVSVRVGDRRRRVVGEVGEDRATTLRTKSRVIRRLLRLGKNSPGRCA